MIAKWALAGSFVALLGATGLSQTGTPAPVAPRLLSDTGLYAGEGTRVVDIRNRPFAPQYPLWSDGAGKRRWVRLPQGATIDANNADRWDFPVGTRFWKEFDLDGRKVETRYLWKVTESKWVFASYAWNDAQTDATLVPESGLPAVAPIAPGKRHSIPSVMECRSCHDSARTEILGFNALQLSDDRDPNALHADTLSPGMLTLSTLVDERLLRPARPELKTDPPRIAVQRMRSRRPSSQMPPIGTVVQDRAAVELLTAWVKSNSEWTRLAATCGSGRS